MWFFEFFPTFGGSLVRVACLRRLLSLGRRLRPNDDSNGAKSVVKIVALLDVFVVVFSLSLFLSDTKYSISLSRALAQDDVMRAIREIDFHELEPALKEHLNRAKAAAAQRQALAASAAEHAHQQKKQKVDAEEEGTKEDGDDEEEEEEEIEEETALRRGEEE